MACYHPIYAYYIPGIETENGKQKYFVRSFKSLQFDDRYQCKELPCGKCDGCKLEKAKQWSHRCVLESSLYEHNYFITLTYNDENLPTFQVGDDESMVLGTLRKDDLRAFNKVLRQHYKRKFGHDGIRFFACGEYGETSFRPHYHVIYFNLPLYDLKPYKKTKDNKMLYTSPTLDKLWKKGYVVVGEVNLKTCNYVARYIQKKQIQNLRLETGDYYDFEGEFTLCSRRPGIGYDYYKSHKDDIYLTDEIHLEGNTFKPPMYFDRQLDKDNPFLFNDIKNTREVKSKIDEVQKGKFDRKAYRLKCELAKKKQIKSLKRSNIPIDKFLNIYYNRITKEKSDKS